VFFPSLNNANGTVDVSPALSSNFAGSMIISGTQSVAAIGQIGNNPIVGLGVTGGNASAMYDGVAVPATTLLYPIVKNNFVGKRTFFATQALTTTVTYIATITDNAGGTHTRVGTIEAGRSVYLDPNTGFTPPMPASNCGTDPNTSPCTGALRVTAAGSSIVGAAIETQTNVSPQQIAQATSLLTPSASNDTLYCPVFKYDHSATRRNTGISVTNIATETTSVQLTLVIAGGPDPIGTTYQVTSPPIPQGSSYAFLGPAGNIGSVKPGSLAAARLKTVPTGGKILAAVNESNAGGAGPLKATTYSCFNASQATGVVLGPLVKESLGNVATTGVTIQNLGSSQTTVAVEYNCGAKGTIILSTGLLSSGAARTFFLTSQVPSGGGSVPANANCAVRATASNPNTDKIVGLFAETSDPFGLLLDTKNYEGLAINTTGKLLGIPVILR
jgi:hypothetical protein